MEKVRVLLGFALGAIIASAWWEATIWNERPSKVGMTDFVVVRVVEFPFGMWLTALILTGIVVAGAVLFIVRDWDAQEPKL